MGGQILRKNAYNKYLKIFFYKTDMPKELKLV